ncbi:MAG TPA: PQQ-dependent sugar dehydrogenase, partial [Verrucomicrobiae bacterium]|nr:PQQ-dependent sugar dehydrogenase [Verrucomicrobiae bacterium]
MQAATLPVGFTETDVGGYWNGLVGITFDEIGTLFQWDRDGRVWVFDNDARLATPLIDISEEVGNWGDHGLLGFALHPNFRQNGYIYLLYVVDHHYLENYGTPNYDPLANDYNRATIGRITRYTARASDNFHSVDPASRTILVGETATNGFPVTFDTHGAGTLMFGTDGTLLASFGDGGQLSDSGSEPTSFYQQALAEGIIKPKENVGSFRAQMIDSLSGKIIRIDPITGDGIPSNPFYDPTSPRAARSRVWVLGLRNPFRIGLRPGTGSHDRADGNPGVIYIGDVGYITWEKLSVATGPGINFGWPFYEGFDPPNSNLDYDTVNQDAPNPLYGTGGCDQPYFRFRDLLQKATLGTPSWPNPCDPAQQIPSSIPCFVHTRPAIDWNHNSSGPSRAGTFSGNDAAVVDIGASGAPVSGPQFGGNCSIGGVWYAADDFPLQYKNTYFIADFGAQWIRNMTFDASNNPVSVRNFASDAGS